MNWNDGYFTDFEYVDVYFGNLSPLLMNLNLTFAGVDTGCVTSIDVPNNISYLELGFGRGLSFALHAITNDGEFVGTDFHPAHALHAKRLSDGLDMEQNLAIYDDSFEQLKKRLEKSNASFDYIVMHGIFSWVSEHNQAILLDIIAKHLKVGGLVYISYNSFPGWDGKWSARKLLTLYKDYAQGTSEEKMRDSIGFFKKFLQTNPDYKISSKQIEGFEHILDTQSLSYIAHEFFNADSSAFHFVDMVEKLEGARCQFASSADIRWHFRGVKKEVNEILETLHDPILKEQLKDYDCNQQFRADIFIKGKSTLTQNQVFNLFLNTHFAIIDLPVDKELQKECMDILAFFAKDDYKFKTAREVNEAFPELSVANLAACFATLISNGLLFPVKNEISQKVKRRCQKFNMRALQAQHIKPITQYFASAYTCSAVTINSIYQIFMLSLNSGLTKEDEIINFSLEVLAKRNDVLQKDNKPLSEKQQKQELKKFFTQFLEKLPIYNSLELLSYEIRKPNLINDDGLYRLEDLL